MAITVDFTDVKDVEMGGFTVIPKGKIVRVEVVKVEEKESVSSGKPYLNFQYKVTEGEYKDTTIFDVCSLSSAALWRLKVVLKALGEDISGSLSIEPEELVGRVVDAKVGIKVYEGKESNTITNFYSTDVGGSSDLPF